ncbi:MAG TPA: hypothetical protein VHZ24_07635 [Pirellulales bacterium]|jgi:rod shape-determining protein MreD|nr:hypothetical protein [Pirellulales bacterium]
MGFVAITALACCAAVLEIRAPQFALSVDLVTVGALVWAWLRPAPATIVRAAAVGLVGDLASESRLGIGMTAAAIAAWAIVSVRGRWFGARVDGI